MSLALARREGLVVRELPRETLVYDLKTGKAHCLNGTAALVWRHCDGETTVAELTALLRRELGLPADEAPVRLALEQLSRRGLLQQPAEAALDVERRGRRDALRKLVALGAVPVVLTLAARPAYAQFSDPCSEEIPNPASFLPNAKKGTPAFLLPDKGTPCGAGLVCDGAGSCVPSSEVIQGPPAPGPCGKQNAKCTGNGQGSCCAMCFCLGNFCSC